MSGAELIAVLSIGASVIQVIDACNKLVDRIKQYRGNAAFVRLRSQLQLFASNIKALDKTATRAGDGSEEEEALLHEVLESCKLRIEELDSLVASLVPGPNSSTFSKTMNAARAFFKDSRVKAILDDLNDYREVILLHICRETEQNTRKLLFLFEEQRLAREAQESQQTMQRTPDPSAAVTPSMAQDFLPNVRRNARRQSTDNGRLCAIGECPCRCHRVVRRILSIVPAAQPITCNCSGRRYVESVTILGKCVQLSLGASWANGLSLACFLQLKNIVKRGYPGFTAIDRCLADEITFEETLVELKTLRSCGVIDFEDSTEFGAGYLEVLYDRYKTSANHQSKVRLAKFLTEQGVTWKGTGDSIFTIVHGKLDLELLRCLPPIDYPNTIGFHCHSTDYWLLKMFTEVSRSQIDIGQYQPLHEAVAIGALDEVKKYLKRNQQLDLTQNFLGQTVLHLAVQWPPVLDLLLKSGYKIGINSRGFDDTSPLCCALQYGYLDSITILVEAGAKFPPACPQNWPYLPSLNPALTASDERPLLHLVDCFMQKLSPSRFLVDVVEPLLFARVDLGSGNLKAIDHLLSRMTASAGEHPHEFKQMGFDPLHYATSSQHAQSLLGYSGFNINASSSEEGYTPLMIFAWFLDPELMRKALVKGARINDTDWNGQTALHHTFKAVYYHRELHMPIIRFWDIQNFTRMMETVAVLFLAGGNLTQRDNCRCYCSPQGCSPMRALVSTWALKRNFNICLVWIQELFIMLELCGRNEVILSLIEELDRFQRSEEIGITHTCCYMLTHEEFSYEAPFDEPCARNGQQRRNYWQHRRQRMESVYKDWEEIREEEDELSSRLEQDRPLSEGHWEARLTKLLARRGAMLDYVEARRRNDFDPSEPLKLELNVVNFVMSMEKSQGYMSSVIPSGDHERWVQQRRRLSTLLIDEYRQVRPTIHEDHDWDVEDWTPPSQGITFRKYGFSCGVRHMQWRE
ncbi:ankyrin repeat protein [Diplodia corticola]|uniref:Ankyrin repeat protein n=1 Tax=Diplodia corticola TaxID=236234 RepID=A0A1J9QM95_9PEZI|nr:ankyrin repeat protein [Diplodia corticola]OJD29186.1 ankyrin repeat protein [Diplodia corticola]